MALLSVACHSGLVLKTTTLFLVQFLNALILVLEFIHDGAARMVFLLVYVSLSREVSDFVLLFTDALDNKLLQFF